MYEKLSPFINAPTYQKPSLIKLEIITKDEVEKTLNNIESKKSIVLDGIPQYMLAENSWCYNSSTYFEPYHCYLKISKRKGISAVTPVPESSNTNKITDQRTSPEQNFWKSTSYEIVSSSAQSHK